MNSQKVRTWAKVTMRELKTRTTSSACQIWAASSTVHWTVECWNCPIFLSLLDLQRIILHSVFTHLGSSARFASMKDANGAEGTRCAGFTTGHVTHLGVDCDVALRGICARDHPVSAVERANDGTLTQVKEPPPWYKSSEQSAATTLARAAAITVKTPLKLYVEEVGKGKAFRPPSLR